MTIQNNLSLKLAKQLALLLYELAVKLDINPGISTVVDLAMLEDEEGDEVPF